MEWWERIPKSNREKTLAKLNEGQYLGLLRKAAARQYPDADFKQSTLARQLKLQPKTLREIEAGVKPCTEEIAKIYLKAMRLTDKIFKKIGNRTLGVKDPPTPVDPPKKTNGRLLKAREERKEKERKEKERLTSTTHVDVREIKGVLIKNWTCDNIVFYLVRKNGDLEIHALPDNLSFKEKALGELIGIGVRVPVAQAVSYDGMTKLEVTEKKVPVKS